MKTFTTAIAAATVLSTAYAAENVTLTVESSDASLSGKGISTVHFGAGINGALIASSGVPSYLLDTDSKEVYQEVTTGSGPVPYNFSEIAGTLTAGVTGAPYALVEDNYLTINGSNSVFYACSKLSYDPYGYASAQNPGVGVYSSDAPSDCKAIKIKVAPFGSSSSSSAAAPSAPVTSADAAKYVNTTVVDTTKWVTIPCSTPTTVTYGSSTYTVTAATTLTVEDCGCTNTPTVSAASSAPASSGPAVVNGASAKGFSAAAIGAAAALYFL